MSITFAIKEIKQSIADAEIAYSRPEGSVRLLAVSKTKPLDAIKEAYAAGQTEFGENYLDEAIDKIQQLDSLDCEWHFIGAIQSNKTRPLAKYFSWVHGIEREKIARRLSQHRGESGRSSPLNCCIQLNQDKEPSKAGISADELPALCQLIQELPNLTLRGLMVIPATRHSFEDQRSVFSEIASLFNDCRKSHPEMDTLSMGMSGDMEAAIAEGSTMVRIGTAIFGSRD